MAEPPGKQKETQGVTGRQSTRLSISVPITISGRDRRGHTFKEDTKTLTIHKYGAKVSTLHEFTLGSAVTIENRAMGQTAKANVVWVGERASPKDPLEIELQLTKAQNMWGIEFPPSDWKDEAPAGVEDTGVEKPIATGTVPTAPKARVKAARPAATLPREASKVTIEAAMAQFGQKTQEAVQAHLKSFQEQLAKLAKECGFQSEVSLREAANRQEQKTAQSLERQVGALEGRLRAPRDELETLLAKFQELQKSVQSGVEATERGIQHASGQALQAALMELEGKVRKDLDAASSAFIQQSRQHVQEETSATIEALSQKISGHLVTVTEDLLSKAVPELQARQRQVAEDTRAQIDQARQETAAQVREKIQQMASEVAPALQTQLEASLVEYAGQLINRLTQFHEERTQASNQAAEESLKQSVEKVQQAIREEIASGRTRDSYTAGAGNLFRKGLAALWHLLSILKNAWRNLLHRNPSVS